MRAQASPRYSRTSTSWSSNSTNSFRAPFITSLQFIISERTWNRATSEELHFYLRNVLHVRPEIPKQPSKRSSPSADPRPPHWQLPDDAKRRWTSLQTTTFQNERQRQGRSSVHWLKRLFSSISVQLHEREKTSECMCLFDISRRIWS